ncbi:claudin-23 [Callorhinchus milii]|uniref:claudin-23 n=1 Tax=Callorhinchus milii TaxID=7868 RepID=UPI0004575267|nr:claudin-23 [Callorhinchus milii]|eukprot:gi/632954860/ref/XP_007893186.1/ PREDICTED: claudin-23-like [Callorhinchus milii]
MRTPVPMIIGVVCAPVGLVLVFTAVLTPQWREGLVNLGKSTAVKYDGLWESCLELEDSKQCWPVTTIYQRDESVQWCRALMLSSLLVCGMGIIMASVGVRCWMDFPLRNVAGASGVVIILAGSLCITPLALYMSHVQEISPDTHTRYRYGNSLYFGWVGSCVQILGGLSLALSFSCPQCVQCREARREAKRSYPVDY